MKGGAGPLARAGAGAAKAVAMALAAAMAISMPAMALAAEADAQAPTAEAAEGAFASPSLTETAQVLTTGALHVVEQRTFAFDQPTEVLRWAFTGLPGESEVSVAGVRMAEVDAEGNLLSGWTTLPETPSNADWRDAIDGSGGLLPDDELGELNFPEDAAWALDKWQRKMYVFFAPTTQRAIFEVDWSATDAIAAYDDMAELYWDYVPERDDLATLDVQATVQLPVPEGAAVVPGETVLAWGHGAPGQVSVAADGTISYQVPQVLAGQYAQAHILFPASWMTNLSLEARQAFSGLRLDNAKAEEEEWTDTYSNQLINSLTVSLAVAAVCAAVLLAAAVLYAACGRERHDVVSLAPGEVRRLAADQPLMARFTAWNHVQPGEPDPDALSRRVAAEGLFDPRSFRLQKGLFIAAAVLMAAAVVAAAAFGAWVPAALLLVTGACVAVIANYMPRRTTKGIALAAALSASREGEPASPADPSLGR